MTSSLPEKLLKQLIIIAVFTLMATVLLYSPALCSATAMQAPSAFFHRHATEKSEIETSLFRIVLIGAVDLYRYTISPRGGSRCGFSPSCSTFGRQALSEHGPVKGLMMTTDRLTRCNAFKGPDQNYLLLPTGKLFDPVSYNDMEEQ